MAAFNAHLQDNSIGFGVNRSEFLSSVETYYGQARSTAREVLQALFFAPSLPSLIKKDIAPKVDAIHEMFKLEVGKALIDKDPPVGKEYEWPVGNAQIRFFPMPGAQGETIVKAELGSASLQYLGALGKPKVLSVAFPLHGQ